MHSSRPQRCSVRRKRRHQTSKPAPSPSRSSTSRFTAKRSKATSKATPSTATSLVFLPPSYGADRGRRYPVVYALHGYSIGAEQWSNEIHVPQTLEGAFAQGRERDDRRAAGFEDAAQRARCIRARCTTGDFENFVARDVVAYMDAHYRTIPDATSRGLVGPLDGRLRRDPHRHEACRCVRQPVHHEPLLPLAARRAVPVNGPELTKRSQA